MPAPKKRRAAPRRAASVSNQLRAIIKARGLTPYAVAIAADVAPSVLTRFMRAERSLTLDTFDRVAAALGLELRETRRGRPAAAKGPEPGHEPDPEPLPPS